MISERVASLGSRTRAFDRVAVEFMNTIGAIPSVTAANEYMQLHGFLKEQANMMARTSRGRPALAFRSTQRCRATTRRYLF